jgi:transposase InsO family protein
MGDFQVVNTGKQFSGGEVRSHKGKKVDSSISVVRKGDRQQQNGGAVGSKSLGVVCKDMRSGVDVRGGAYVGVMSRGLGLWHRRLGHLNCRTLRDMQVKGVVNGLDKEVFKGIEQFDCVDCNVMKATRLSFRRWGMRRVDEILKLVHSDICGPIRVDSLGGAKYILTFTDDCSRMSEVFFLKRKSEVFEKFKEYQLRNERATGKKLKTLRTDNGGEFVNGEFDEYLRGLGIRHECTMSYTPQQNGVSERLNRTLVTKARCMLHDAGLSENFWAEAVKAANYVKNRSASDVCGGVTPYELWYGRKPNVGYLRVFGCTAYVCLPSQVRTGKFSERAKKGIFIGYEENGRGYRVWDPVEKKVLHSRDVKFTEFSSERKNSQVCDLLESDRDSESDSDVVRIGIRGEDMCSAMVPENRGNGFWEVRNEQVEALGVSVSSDSIDFAENTVQAEIHREESGHESESGVSGDGIESEVDDVRWIPGKSLRKRTEKVKPAAYGMVSRRSIFEDSDTDETDLSRFVDPRDF